MINQFPFPLSEKKTDNLTKIFWLLAIILILYVLFAETDSFRLNIICSVVISVALLPSYLWASGKALGMPIFPMFSGSFIWTYALPLISKNQNVLNYSVEQRLYAGFTTLSFLIVGCAVWFQFVKKAPLTRPSCRSLTGSGGNTVFFAGLTASVFFNVARAGGWLYFFSQNGGVLSLLQNTVVAFTALSSFVLTYRLGKEELTKKQSSALVLLLAAFIVSSALSFLLITSATVFLTSVAAYIIGRRKVPVALILIVFLCLSFLHAGKGEMRERYGEASGQSGYIQPWQYITVYGQWIDSSTNELSLSKLSNDYSTDTVQSFGDRASVIQMLMLSQSLSPRVVPFLNGYTYQILPEMLVPRLLYPDKPWSHEGTIRLNVHYGRQTRLDALRTTIAWGLLAEAYANFGYSGCIGLAIIMGSFYGFVSRLSINVPILSLQSLVAVLLTTYAIQSEWTAGVYIAALGQHGMIVAALAIVLMKEQPNQYFTAQNYALRKIQDL